MGLGLSCYTITWESHNWIKSCRVHIINSKRGREAPFETPFETGVITQQVGTRFLFSYNLKGIQYFVSYCYLSPLPNGVMREVPIVSYLVTSSAGELRKACLLSFHWLLTHRRVPCFPLHVQWCSTHPGVCTNIQLSCQRKWLTFSAIRVPDG